MTKEFRLSLCERTPEGRLFEVAVCQIKNGEARWMTKTPATGDMLGLASLALDFIPKQDPEVLNEDENS